MSDEKDKLDNKDVAKKPEGAPAKKSEDEEAAEEEVKTQHSLSEADLVRRNSALDIVAQNFLWMSEKVGPHIQALGADLKKEDEPDWSQQLLSAALDVALTAASAGFGEFIAARFAEKAIKGLAEKAIKNKELGEAVGSAGKEFAKSMTEEGTAKGIEKGRKQLEGGEKGEVIDKFILSQRDGATDMYKADHDKFQMVTRHRVKTVAEAEALRDASNERYQEQPEVQESRVTDAWISYQAQMKFGVTPGKDGGAPQTDMANQARRDREYKPDYIREGLKDYGGEGQAPAKAPNRWTHDQEGVLFVFANVPAIDSDWDPVKFQRSNLRMTGKPTVGASFLSGVNEEIRDKYAKTPLADVHIPRVIEVIPDGMPRFQLNLNEAGKVWDDGEKEDWLEDRAEVGNPAMANEDKWTKKREGLKLLLQELVTGTIHKGSG